MSIAVAVSGGADSLLALALLREQGHPVLAVHGLFLPESEAASALAERLAGICARLGVRFAVIDLRGPFEAFVVEPFVRDYARGLTPNPCARCNPLVKFGALLDRARALGASRLATGHYARLVELPGVGRALARGLDPAKDQSYFLSLVPREVLDLAVFPLGERRKQDTLAALRERGIEPPLAAESQEICFVPHDDYQAFLLGRGVDLPGGGLVARADGSVVGRHRGLWRHTEGQRRGLGIPFGRPLYVLGKDVANNVLRVGTREELLVTGCRVRDLNVLVPPDVWPEDLLAQTRSRQKAAPARCEVMAQGLAIRFLEPQAKPAPGQVAVVYADDGTVLAGGIISEIT